MRQKKSENQPEASSARRRLLDAATRLFYEGGIHAVGIDRIIAEAGVAKATFYNHFPSKDDLVVAYLEEIDRLGGRQWPRFRSNLLGKRFLRSWDVSARP